MRLSKFVKIYKVGDDYAYYHSLRMKPVYLSAYEHAELEKALTYHCAPDINQETIKYLLEYMILAKNDEDDNATLEKVRSYIPKPRICIAYFILTEKCNLACKYCFLGNAALNIKNKIIHYGVMTEKIAERAVDYFVKQTQFDKQHFSDKKEIIFYGGEPLLNFKTIKIIVKKIKEHQLKGRLTTNLQYSMVTNGMLLNAEMVKFFKENNFSISISLDGADEESNSDRVDRAGNPIYDILINKIKYVRAQGLNIGLSVTLTEETLEKKDLLIDFLLENKIYNLSFNILLQVDNFVINKDYYEKATNFILSFYEKTKNLGIFEDRFNRKLNAFINSQVYFSDCAATSGSQIVITPSGEVGICHGCTGDGNYIIGNIYDDQNLEENKEIIKWSQISPLNHKECLDCEALGICGGGCPMNAAKISKESLYTAIDKPFCIHAKHTLKYLIEKLYEILLEERRKE